VDRFEEVKLRVKEANELVSLVEDYALPLRRRGQTLVALCPFHREKTPSFTVFPDTQHFMCFGCQKAGDVFTFVMEREGWTFREAFESLAERAGIEVQGVFGDRGPKRPKVDVHGALAQVRDWFRHHLESPAGEAARRYLHLRGLAPAVEGFGLGYHPPGPSLSRWASESRLPLQVLEQAGLLTGAGREPFAGRLMFPIEDERGRVVGFGGRVLEDQSGQPKYINSPESPFFNKRRLLFGLRRAKRSGVRRILVMEGYTDVIACHLAGFTGAVATLGTALTADHARLLERYATEGAVLVFDGDEAGRRAAERAFAELQNSRLALRIALAGEGVDPADMVARLPDRPAKEVEAGRARLGELLDSAEDATTVWFRILRQRLDLSQAVGVERAAGECGRILKGVDSELRREALLQDMARHLGVSPGALGRMVGRVRAVSRDGSEDSPDQPETSPIQGSEMELLGCLLAQPPLLDELEDPALTQADTAGLHVLMREGFAEGHGTRDTLARYLFSRCAEQPGMSEIVARCVERSRGMTEPAAFLEILQRGRLAHLARQQARSTRRRLQEAMSAGDQQLADRLTRLYVEQLRQT
jgi:DNA primase